MLAVESSPSTNDEAELLTYYEMNHHCFDCCHNNNRRKMTIDSTDDGKSTDISMVLFESRRRIGRRRSNGGYRSLSRWSILVLIATCFVSRVSSQQSTDSNANVPIANSEYFQAQPQSTPYYVRAGESGPTLQCAASPKYAQDAQYRLMWVKVIQNGSPRIISQGDDNLMANDYDLDRSSCHGCYNLRMRNVSYDDDNGRFYCQLLGPSKTYIDSMVANVVVLVKPSPPQVSGQTTSPLREGQLAQLECQSIGGNPAPRITWKFANDTDATSLAKVRNATDLASATVSSLSWPISYRENNQYLRCFVWNEAMGDSVAPMEMLSSRFAVQYSPKVTAGPSNPYSVEDQKQANLFCSADANPPARSYVWSYSPMDASLAALGSPASNTPSSNQQNLTITVTRQHRGIYTCTATNDLGTGQDSLQLDVQYAPKINFITGTVNQSASSSSGSPQQESMLLVSEEQAVTVTCQPDANPPATSVQWTGPNGQSLSDSAVLNLRSVSRSEAGNYTCTAKNTLTVSGGGDSGSIQREGSGVLEIKVKHAPGRARIIESEPAVVGGQVNLTCVADDPGAPAAQFKWKAPGQQEYEMIARPTYVLENIQLDKAGEYSCVPFNEVGFGQPATHRLVIYQPAQLDVHLKPEDQKKENDAYELVCSASGHPAPNITWYKDDEPIALNSTNGGSSDPHWTATTRADGASGDCSGNADSNSADQCSYKVIGTLKWIDGIRWTDKGYISCRAYNGAGRAAESKTLLRVQHRPYIVNDPNRPYVAAELGQSAMIECKASASPEPLFRWSRGGQQGDLVPSDSSSAAASGSKQQYTMSQMKLNESYDLYEQKLIIKAITDDDFGEYQCKANNNLGEDSFLFKLQRKTKPLAPEDFKATERTHLSLILSWLPGFDGGYDQSFTIEQIDTGLTYNVTAAEATNPMALDLHSSPTRLRRHVGIEKPMRARYNISNLAPAFAYSFRIKSYNRLGETEWSERVVEMTADAPLDQNIKKPEQSVYDSNSNNLEVRPTMDTGKFCLLVQLRQPNGAWQTWDCVDPDANVKGVPPASNLRVRFCNRYTMYCSEATEVLSGVGTAFPAPIIVTICVAAVALIALAAVICFCCFRSRRQKGQQANGGGENGRNTFSSSNGGTNGRAGSIGTGEKSKDPKAAKKHKKNGSTSNGTGSRNGTTKKDYESETNQARPKAISGPYLTKNTPGPMVGLGVDQNTGSSKDSGVFTTSSAINNYPYESNGTARNNGNPYVSDPALGNGQSYSVNGNGNGSNHHLHHHAHANGGRESTNGVGPTMLNRPPSYDGQEHWGATDGYGLANNGGGAYLNGNGHHHHARGNDYHDGQVIAENGSSSSHHQHHPHPNGSYYEPNTPTSVGGQSSTGGGGFVVDPYGGGAGHGGAVGFVDMNPNGGGGSGSGSGAGGDGSMNSGYSTPTQRRVMREIIV